MERVIHGLPVVTGPDWEGVNYFCTTRIGGLGVAPHDTLNVGLHTGDQAVTVAENRQRVRTVLPGEPLWLRQVHGTAVYDADVVVPVTEPPAADACVTLQPRRVLTIMVADCLPIVLTDARACVLGVAHAGWRGLSQGVLERTLQTMQDKAPQAGGWRAWIGPGIGPDAFDVGPEVLDAFVADGGAAAQAYFRPHPDIAGKWRADLAGLAALRLGQAGVHQVAVSGLCTVTDQKRFFSYRRDGETGRMALMAWLG